MFNSNNQHRLFEKVDWEKDHLHEQQQQLTNPEFLLMKIKSKSSSNIDQKYGSQPKSIGRTMIRPQTSQGKTCSRLKKMLLFGNPSKSVTPCDLVTVSHNGDNNGTLLNGSTSDLESELNLLNNFGSSGSLIGNNLFPTSATMNKKLARSSCCYSSPTSINSALMGPSPKMVSNCLEEINGHNLQNGGSAMDESRRYLSKRSQKDKMFSKPVRVIKPTAIHPSVMDNYDPPRPSTSVGVHTSSESLLMTKNHSSAFHQPLNSSAFTDDGLKHGRSNSLNEPPFNFNNPYSNPISMESIEQEKGDERVWNLSSSVHVDDEPIHMTLEEVRRIAFGSPERLIRNNSGNATNHNNSQDTAEENKASVLSTSKMPASSAHNGLQNAKSRIKNLFDNLLNKTPCIGTGCTSDYGDTKDLRPSISNVWDKDNDTEEENRDPISNGQHRNRSPVMNHIRDYWLHTIGEITPTKQQARKIRPRRRRHRHHSNNNNRSMRDDGNMVRNPTGSNQSSPFIRRALPPVPSMHTDHNNNVETIGFTSSSNNSGGNSRRYQSLQRVSQTQFKTMTEYERQKYLDYVSSIEKVKNCGWYWGPISGEMAEKLLDPEPCGSFLVRDSSDEHYIFSLSFKLDGMVRHVRIEQEQGNFSFGSLKKFRSTTIVDFIESAMEHSRSGQFLFFLRLGPELGPIRVQLLQPVSRFKRVQSLQHICRFVILQYVRRDQIHELALPDYLRRYLDTPYYYSEELAQMQHENDDQQRLLEEKRKFFLQTDYQSLMDKMLINRENIERELSIRLSDDFPTVSSPTCSKTLELDIDELIESHSDDVEEPENDNSGPNNDDLL